MTRGAIVAVLAVAALWSPQLAAAGVQRPNPVLVGRTVDYVTPLQTPSGGVAALEPLDPAVTEQAVADGNYLAYLQRDDLGGFVPAPVGQFPLSSGGRNVVGAGRHQSQIPTFAQAASGVVQSFAFVGGGGSGATPDQGTSPVQGLGTPPHVSPPTNTNTVPPPNQGFAGAPPTTTTTPSGTTTTTGKPPTGGATTTAPTTTGRGGGGGGGGGGTTTTTTTTPTTTTTTTTTGTTTTTTTTSGTTTTTSGGGGGGSGGGSSTPSCGTTGLAITSDLDGCRIYAINMAPGDATYEHVTLRNDSGGPVTLSLRAAGTTNHLWNDLQMGVWQTGAAAPSPLPPLLWWTSGDNQLTTLAAGASVSYTIELYLPGSAGNDDQGLTASIDFIWHAQG
jgi:hypothetical protein